jgi:hypothetical protein
MEVAERQSKRYQQLNISGPLRKVAVEPAS